MITSGRQFLLTPISSDHIGLWGAVPTRIEAKMNDELGLGSNKVELRRHRVREEIRNSARTENDLQKIYREIQLNRQKSGA